VSVQGHVLSKTGHWRLFDIGFPMCTQSVAHLERRRHLLVGGPVARPLCTAVVESRGGSDAGCDNERVLRSLGVGPEEEAAYEALLDGPSSVPDLCEYVGEQASALTKTLESLEALGLVSRLSGAELRYAAVAPELALDVLALRREEELKRARVRVEQLSARFRAATGSKGSTELIEIITGRDAVLQRMYQIARSARHQFRGIDKPPYLIPQRDTGPTSTFWSAIARGGSAEPNLLRRGVRLRVIYDKAALDDEDLSPVEASVAAGEEARLLPSAPTKLFMADERIAMLPLQVGPTTIQSYVVIYESALVDALAALFEMLWERALPLTFPVDDQPALAPDGPNPAERRILALLNAGVPDATIAKQLELSTRTMQRRLHELTERLGVQTRFQAGVQASRRGWLDPSTAPSESSSAAEHPAAD
jgi:sugar-specific transcriptional regulator TrmB/DNA-binding CsgD family transcriptional regulator